MNVLIFLGSLNSGGTENLFLDILRNNTFFNRINFFLVSRKAGNLQKQFVTSVKKYQVFSLKNLKSFFQFRKFVQLNDIQIIHANQALDVIKLKFALLFMRVKIVYSIHHFDHSMSRKHLFLFKIGIRISNHLIFVSNYQKKYFQEKYKIKKQKLSLLYNGIDFSKLVFKNEGFDIRNEIGVSNETILICSVGNFVPGRNQLLLCKFAKLMKDSKFDFQLIFVGNKNETKFRFFNECYSYCCKNDLLDCITFLGSRNNVPQLLQNSDAFIYSSGHDSFGIAVVEALYSMNNVFLNDWAVMKEISNHGAFATIYKSNDENDLFSKFSSNFEENKNTSSDSKVDFLKNNFSIEKHLESLELIYRNLIN